MALPEQKKDTMGNGFRNLLFFLLIYMVGSPFLSPYPSLEILAHVSLTISLFFAVYTVQKQQEQRSHAMALLLPLLILYWLGIYDIIPFSQLGSYLLLVVYFGLLVHSYIFQIARSHRVTRKLLYATFCLYLIVGLFWGSLYALLAELTPGAYNGKLLENSQDSTIHIYNYFSLVTLTTLGYGDITPQTAGAAALCQMEAIVGQFFTTVLVAWLVGMYISDRKTERHTP